MVGPERRRCGGAWSVDRGRFVPAGFCCLFVEGVHIASARLLRGIRFAVCDGHCLLMGPKKTHWRLRTASDSDCRSRCRGEQCRYDRLGHCWSLMRPSLPTTTIESRSDREATRASSGSATALSPRIRESSRGQDVCLHGKDAPVPFEVVSLIKQPIPYMPRRQQSKLFRSVNVFPIT